MNTYFIHTIELSYRCNYSEIIELTKELEMYKYKDEYRSFKYIDFGLSIISRKCKKEAKDGKGDYKLIIIVNLSRLISPGTYINQIDDKKTFTYALTALDVFIEKIFPELNQNDFKLSRIDLTRDIKEIPQNITQEYILIMRRMALSRGFRLNTELEENTDDFRYEDSINVVSSSLGAEFVVYNKYVAAIDQGYDKDVIEYYAKTMRVELRCKRKYICTYTKEMLTDEALVFMYDNIEILIKSFYDLMFKYRSDLCFISEYWQHSMVDKLINGKQRKSLLHRIIKEMNNRDCNLDSALFDCYNSRNSRLEKLSAFNDMGFSPIPIVNKRISYMSSLDKLFGYGDNATSKCYKRLMHCKGRKKEMFEYEP